MRFVRLSECSRQRHYPPIGLARPLYVVDHSPRQLKLSGVTSTLRYSHRRPSSSISQAGTSSHRLWLLYRVSPVHHRKGRVATRWLTPLAPSEVSAPTAFASHEEPHTPGGSQPTGYVASTGFSPSRRLAPLATSWACSIPGALMGFALRGLDPPLTPYVLSNAATLRAYPRDWPTTGLPTGALTSTEARTPGLGISQVTGPRASLSFSAPRYLAMGS
jgi:hypothetical protein